MPRKPNPNPRVPVTLRLPKSLSRGLTVRARQAGLSLNAYMLRCLTKAAVDALPSDTTKAA